MPDLSKQFRTREKKKRKAGPATYRLIDGGHGTSPEAPFILITIQMTSFKFLQHYRRSSYVI